MKSSTKSQAFKAAILVMILTFISRVFGFFREITIGTVLGTSSVADAYIVSLSVPYIVFFNIASSIATTYIPMYVKIRKEDGEKKGVVFTNNISNIIYLLSITLSLVCIFFSKKILSIVAFGFNEETIALAVSMSRIIFINIFFMGANAILTGYLQANNKFIMPALIAIPNSIVVIISLFMYNRVGITGIAMATVVGSTIQFTLLIISAMLAKFKFMPILDFKTEEIKIILILAMPVFFGSSIEQLDTMVDRMLASGLQDGSIAALNYANKLNGFVFSITSLSISAVIYPMLSKMIVEKDKDSYKSVLQKSINVITFLLIPMTVIICVLNEPMVAMLFKRGAFDERSTQMTASALLFYSLGMVFFGYRDIFGKAFYSMQDTKSPTINSLVSLSINIILNIILSRYMMHNGLALATSISAFVAAVILGYILRKKIGAFGGRQITINIVRAIIASAIMGIVVWYIYINSKGYYEQGNLLEKACLFGLFLLSGTIAYGIVLFFLSSNKERKDIFKMLKK